MSGYRTLVFFIVVFWTVAVTQSAPLKTRYVKLEPFDVVSDCLPFNLKVQPTKGSSYRLKVEAEGKLLDVVRHTVRNKILTLGLTNGFKTKRVVRVTLFVPEAALKRIVKSSASVLVVAPGLKVQKLTVMTSGVASVQIVDGDINDLVVQSSSSSVVAAEGTIDQARVDAYGTSSSYINGIRKTAEVFAKDLGKITINPSKSDVTVHGHVDGLGSIFITKGNCKVDGPDRSGCKTISVKKLPKFKAEYSCGLVINGSVQCERDGSHTVHAASRVDGASVSSFASASGDAMASAFASSTVSAGSSSRQFQESVSTSGDEAVAVASVKCKDKEIEMLT